MKTLTVSLYGGLGNQLFQYAVGRALSLQFGTDLAFDLYGFEVDKVFKRTYELGQFNLPRDIELTRKPVIFKMSRVIQRFSGSQSSLGKAAWPHLLVEGPSGYQANFFPKTIRGNVYISGYWQDERYFLTAMDYIRKELTLRGGLSSANQELRKKMRENQSVAIHVRRLHNVVTTKDAEPDANAETKGIALGQAYYQTAIEEINKRVQSPEFFVFSDYPQWARENLIFDRSVTFLDPGRGPDLEDMLLMSNCRHHVIANSSFSWWGAWLAQNKDQVVVAPKVATLMPNIPNSWIRV